MIESAAPPYASRRVRGTGEEGGEPVVARSQAMEDHGIRLVSCVWEIRVDFSNATLQVRTTNTIQ